jgi:hypothetical protein
MDASELLKKVKETKRSPKPEKRNSEPDKSFDSVMASISKNWEPAQGQKKQISTKERDKSVTKASQERDKSVTKASQERHRNVTELLSKKNNKIESVTKASQERRPECDWVRDESVIKASRERDYPEDISELSGQSVGMLQYLFQVCSSIGQRTTPQIKNSLLVKHLNTSSGGLRSLILRLKKGSFLSIKKTKNGPSGWRVYELPEATYKALADLRNTERALPKRDESVTRASPRASLGASLNPPSSNSSNIINTNTTSEKDDTWLQEVQLPNNLKNLGFGVSHLKQLKNKFSLSSEEIQKGLEAFSYDIDKGEGDRLKARGVQNLIGFFFGAMKSGGYNPVNEGFQTAEEAAEQEMLIRLKRRQHERESRKKELRELLFKEWLETKDEKELAEIAPPPLRHMDSLHIVALQDYFYSNEFDRFKMELE